MEPSLHLLGQTFVWVLKNTLQASVLIVLMLIAQWAFRKRLSPGWRHALWLLVLLRLLLPITPPSPWSLFNLSQLTSSRQAVDEPSISATETVAVPPGVSESTPPHSGPWAALTAPEASQPTHPGPASEADQHSSSSLARAPGPDPTDPQAPWGPTQGLSLLSWVWGLGVLGLTLQVMRSGRRLNAELARQHAVVNPTVGDVLAEAQQRMGVHRVLPVVQSRAVGSPALMGFIRPWLLLPEGVASSFPAPELRYVFLHELAHLKRRDILVNWLMTAVQILHWFNPLVWLAFSRMRDDREMACDAHVLGKASESDRHPYGRTMIKLLEGFSRPAVATDLVGILENPNLMKRRITMITHDNSKGRWPWLAPVLLCILGLFCLTDAKVMRAATMIPAAQSKPGLTRVHQGPGDTQWWAISPNGRLACYSDWGTGGYGLMDLVRGSAVSLVAKLGWDETQEFGHTGAFSPDGQQLAYVFAGDEEQEIRLVDTQTKESRVLLTAPYSDYPEVHDWHPDGRSVVVLKSENNAERKTRGIQFVSAETGQVTRELEVSLPRLSRLRVSPDGEFVAFAHYTSPDNREGDVSLLRVSDGKVFPLVVHTGEDYPVEWNPDGESLLFVSNRRGDFDLWEITVQDGKAVGEPQLQVPSSGNVEGLGFTTDGVLHYSVSIELKNVILADLAKSADGRWRLSPTGGRLPRAFGPAWSHNGEQLAFFRQDPAQQNLRLCVHSGEPATERSFDTGLPHPLMFDLAWSADDRAVRYRYKEVKALGIHELVLDEGRPKHIDRQVRAISPDGRLLATPGDGGLDLLDRETGKLRRHIPHAEPVNRIRMVFSPSGQHLAYTTLGSSPKPGVWVTDGSTLWITPVAGGEPKAVFQGEGSPGSPVWLPNEQAVLCLVRPPAGQGGAQKLWRIPCDGGEGEPVEFDANGAEVRAFAVHPDGQRVAVETNEQWTELWAVQGLLTKTP